ncbi:hypothetical protein [Salipaludibacillus aurantiacus]|uniref:Threonine dehydratase n=1 Tax=Salipaludibacillus aurantiacus TaxID=1601833 RepID=A0A1H9NYJ1_9BACI|nr:hypothetical protein [Salipaludibacillus aurantiacus]SER40998.1 hypothetical protein SAMN05518684_10165 [Salipaludibacillus aurantiacus]
MRMQLIAKDSAIPCEVTADADNGIYTIRKNDTSGEVFNDLTSLISWVQEYWGPDQFVAHSQYNELLAKLSDLEKDDL